MQIDAFNGPRQAAGLAFLKAKYESSMFLLGNLESLGPCLTDHHNSGDYKVVVRDDEVIGVFCLSRRGNLLVQVGDLDFGQELVRTISDQALAGNLPVKGILGPWGITSALWDELAPRIGARAPSFSSKEPLYRLNDLQGFSKYEDSQVRCLEALDFDQWKPSRIAYVEEEGLKQDLNEDQLRTAFQDMVDKQTAWGLFGTEGALEAMVGLNSRAQDVGQVGGVYTTPALRKRGHAKRAMKAMMRDCFLKHGITKMILFTGETNIAAQRLYESLGYERIGHFGIIFS